jgi:hypothetical protein
MPLYQCSGCGQSFVFEDQGPKINKSCPFCKGPKDFTKTADSPPTNWEDDNKARAGALWNQIKIYRGGQCLDYSAVEELLYSKLSTVVRTVIVAAGDGDITTVNRTKEQVVQLITSAKPPVGKCKDIMLASAMNCLEYPIGSFTDILKFIRMMGTDQNAENPCRILHLFNKHRVLITAKDHYCFPLELNGAAVDLRSYNHDYDKLMETPLSPDEQCEFMKTGGCYTANALSVNIANLICESDRNWNQLFLSLVLLVKKETTTCLAKQLGCFPMAGGGWKNHGSWGPGANPQGPGTGATEDIKRWMVKVTLIDIMGLPIASVPNLISMLCSGKLDMIDQFLTQLEAHLRRLFEGVIGKLQG